MLCFMDAAGLFSKYQTTYVYSAALVNFEPVCYYYGLGGDGALAQDKITELNKYCAFVAQICFFMF